MKAKDNTNRFNGESMEQLLEYWKVCLADAPILELPTDRSRPVSPSFCGKTQQFSLSSDLTEKLKALSQREGTTLFMTLVSAFQVLLHRYSGQDDIVLGTSSTRQNRLSYPETENLDDLFVNPLILRANISDNLNFRELLAQIREIVLEAYANQDIPFEKLVETLNPQRNHSPYSPFQVMLVFHNIDDKPPLNEITSKFPQVDTKTALDLVFELSENQHGMTGKVEYATELFETSTIERLIGHFKTLLGNIVAQPEARLPEFSMLSIHERQQLLVAWNNTVASFPSDKCIHELFELQAAETPDALAVVYESSQISYADLNSQANQLAHHLRKLGVKPDGMVAICVQPSLNMLVGLLAILKAGGTYVPLSPSYPINLLATIIEESTPVALLTQNQLSNLFVDIAKFLPVIDLDSQSPVWQSQPNTNLNRQEIGLTPTHLAYVIYTSGSTGKPKGVMIEHSGVCNMITDIRKHYNICTQDRVLQFAPITFDVSVQEIFMTLCSGATLIVRNDDWITDASNFWALCEKNAITVVKLPAAFWQQLVQENQVSIPSRIRLNIIGGEAVNSKVLADWFERKSHRPKLFNAYGPTETTVNSTIHETSADCLSWQSIGRPIANTRIYILDANHQPTPIGVPGELYIGGVGVARGYLNQPELTAERFLTDPFVEDTNARMYKTGDSVRWLRDGTIEFMGRNDFQVKIRGFRIELGYIEAKLAEHPSVREVAVLALEDSVGFKRLVAYLVLKDNFTPNVAELREFLKQQMPDFMMPSAFVFIDALPLTVNGKLNRKALPEPDQNQYELEANFVAPRNFLEKQLTEIWGNVLRIERIGIHDNFFEYGGHSLLAMQIIVRIQQQLSVKISLNSLLTMPTIAELAKLIKNTDVKPLDTYKPLTRHPRSDCSDSSRNTVKHAVEEIDSSNIGIFVFPTSSAQQGLWLVDRVTGATTNYNIPWIRRINGKLNVDALEAALNEIIQRHEILRTYFTQKNGVPVQVIQSSFSISLPVVDIRQYSEEQKSSELARLIQDNKTTAFNLEKLPLLQAHLLRLDDEKHIFLLTFHHIISDGWSLDVFTREMSALYNAFSQEQSSPLAELPIQYADYAVWQQEWLQGEVIEQLIDYWKVRLADVPTLELPTDRPRPTIPSFRAKIQQFSLSPHLTEGLKSLSRHEGVTLFMMLLAAFQVLLHRYTGQDDIVIGTPSAGRNRLEFEDLIGFFVNPLVLRTDLSGNPCFHELLARIRNIALNAYEHQDIPFEKLVGALEPQHDYSRNPLFQVWFALQNTEHIELQLNNLSVEYMPVIEEGAKFDLAVYLKETPNGIEGYITYSTDLFEAATIDHLMGHFQNLLEGIVAHPEALLSELPLLTELKHQQLGLPDPRAEIPEPPQKPVTELFLELAELNPEMIAVSRGTQQWTYGEMADKVKILAAYIHSHDIHKGDVVAVVGLRSFGTLASVLATLTAGCVFVTIDSALPETRQKIIFKEASPKAIFSIGEKSSQIEWMLEESHVLFISVDAETGDLIGSDYQFTDDKSELPEVKSNDAAYIFFTSGSTGTPKGILGIHKGLSHFVHWQRNRFSIRTGDRVSQLTNLAFDVVLRDIFLPLTSGATICLPEISDQLNPLPWLAREHISAVHTTPTLLQSWLTQIKHPVDLSALRWLFIAGEPLTETLISKWRHFFPNQGQIVNLYGPTETTLAKCFYPIPEQVSPGIQPVGYLLPEAQALIFREDSRLCGIGELGEIVLRTPFRSLGYINLPEEMERRFRKNPFRDDDKDILYFTGDLGRYRPNGLLEIAGRIDDQVKIRGVRIEPAEVMAVLMRHDAVNSCYVLATKNKEGQSELVAYIVVEAQNSLGSSKLRSYLNRQLPAPFVPSIFVFVDNLPRLPNGKVDRKSLPSPEQSRQASPVVADSAPRNKIERELIDIWKNLLKLDNISIQENFFDLGGHSLLAVNAAVMINEQFNLNLPLGILYQSPTIEELAILISSGNQQSSYYSLVPIQTQGSRPRLFAIHTIKLADLPRYLGKDQPLYFLRYGMAAKGHDSSVRLPLLQELASHYIKEMQQLQPQGPYYMIGFSFGGVIAYEMACQLAANGHQVSFLGLLDTYLTKEKLSLPFHRKFHKLFKLSPSQFVKRIQRKVNDIVKVNKYGTEFWPHFYTEAPDKLCRIGYQPKSYNSRVILFQGFEWDSVLSSYPLPEEAWRTLLGDRLEVQQISGSHFAIFKEPHVKVLAEKLIACIDKAVNQ